MDITTSFKKATEDALVRLEPVPPDPTGYDNRFLEAFHEACKNFSTGLIPPFELAERVLAPLHTRSFEVFTQLRRPPSDYRGETDRGSDNYHMVHIQSAPDTILKDNYNLTAAYDVIIPRKIFHFHIFRAIEKLERAEQLINEQGLTVITSLQEAQLIILLSHLREPAYSTEPSYNSEAIQAGPNPEDPNEIIWLDNGNPFYQRYGDRAHRVLPPWPNPLTPIATSPRRTNIRMMTEDHVIQAYKMLMENFTMFIVRGGFNDVSRDRTAFVTFEDVLDLEDKLTFTTDITYVPELPKAANETDGNGDHERPRKKAKRGGDAFAAEMANIAAKVEAGKAARAAKAARTTKAAGTKKAAGTMKKGKKAK